MNRNQVIELLQIAASYDGRKASEAAVHAWADAADRGRWTYPEAAEAIKTHYAECTAFIMPGNITERVRSARRDAEERRSVEAAKPIDRQRLAGLISDAFRAIGDDDEKRRVRRTALSIRCPFCHAAPQSPCTRPARGGQVPTKAPHPSRVEAATRPTSSGQVG